MFLLSFLPDWIFYILLFLSGAGLFAATFLGKLPFIGTYAKPIQIGSAIALVFSIYMCGGIANEADWREKVLKQQAEIAQLKQKEAEENKKAQSKMKMPSIPKALFRCVCVTICIGISVMAASVYCCPT